MTERKKKMNKNQLIWGSVCLALAGLLVVLNLILPPESLTFMIGNTNLPWILPVILACVGFCILLIAAISQGKKVTPETKPPEAVQDPEKVALNKRLEGIGWGLFLIMLGGFSFVPGNQIPKGAWSIGIGLIMLGLNAARYSYKIRMSGFTTFLGIISLLFGIAEWIGMTSLQGALLLLVLGALVIFKPWFDKRQLFGKAGQSRI
jgi:hypothetical protein